MVERKGHVFCRKEKDGFKGIDSGDKTSSGLLLYVSNLLSTGFYAEGRNPSHR